MDGKQQRRGGSSRMYQFPSSSSHGEPSGASPARQTSSPATLPPGTGQPAAAAASAANTFANDGSFMEMFKKKMEEEKRRKELQGCGDETDTAEEQTQKPVVVATSFVGKRRGGVFLKTGMVAKKQKEESEREPGKSDAWSSYMAEVKKYKAHQCGDDDKTRPLVK